MKGTDLREVGTVNRALKKTPAVARTAARSA
jgi:hypothetical protein